MKIDVEKWMVRSKKTQLMNIVSYKVLNKEFCCDGIKCLPVDLHYTCPENIDLYELNEDDNGLRFGLMLDELYTWYDGDDTQEDIRYYLIDYCPMCGEKIEIDIIREIDKTDEHSNLKSQYEEMHNKWIKCDSKKKSRELERQWREIDKVINEFYKTDSIMEQSN